MTATADPTTTFRIRLSKTDVDALKDIARREGVRLGADQGWCDLVRAAVKKMVRDQKPVG
ncbi:MAG: hypothetical protein U0804_12765 [Gemmataceae bacterium]